MDSFITSCAQTLNHGANFYVANGFFHCNMEELSAVTDREDDYKTVSTTDVCIHVGYKMANIVTLSCEWLKNLI